MRDIALLISAVWLIVIGYWFGWKFLRTYRNYLLDLEWLVVGVSASNFLIGALLGVEKGGIAYAISFFLDAFSRSVGFTIILVMGMMAVTHRYKPTVRTEISVFVLAIAAALYLRKFHDNGFHVVPATFYVVVNLLTALFLAYVAKGSGIPAPVDSPPGPARLQPRGLSSRSPTTFSLCPSTTRIARSSTPPHWPRGEFKGLSTFAHTVHCTLITWLRLRTQSTARAGKEMPDSIAAEFF